MTPDFPSMACRVPAALCCVKRSSSLPACQSLQAGSALTLDCWPVAGKRLDFILRELRMEGKIPFPTALQAGIGRLGRNQSHGSVSPLVRERYCFCTSLGVVERVIKIHPKPTHKHRPETTDFLITKKYCIWTMIGSAPPLRSSPRFPLAPQSQQPDQPSPHPRGGEHESCR